MRIIDSTRYSERTVGAPLKPISLSLFAPRGNDCDGWHLVEDLR
jgi:hypothetical protein